MKELWHYSEIKKRPGTMLLKDSRSEMTLNGMASPQGDVCVNKIRIGFFNMFFPVISGGAEYQTYLLAQCLDLKKFDIFFLSLDSCREGMEVIDGIKVYFFRPGGPLSRIIVDEGYIVNFRYIKSILQVEQPDIIYQMTANSATGILKYFSKKLGFKFIWACASDYDLWYLRPFSLGGLRSIPNYLLKRWGMGRADLILAQTEKQKMQIASQFHRNAILQKNPHPVPLHVPEKPTNEIWVLWVANFKLVKQPNLFIDLADRCQDLKMVRFFMIGRPEHGEWQSNLELRIQKLNNLRYMGSMSQEKVNEYLECAHILVNTSKFEGFSNTFIQAWLRNVPVVSLNTDPDRLLSVGGLGFCSENFENLYRDVLRLINDRQLRESIGARARQYACEHHSIDKIGKQFQKLLIELHRTDLKYKKTLGLNLYES
jgi:glycosyltransferase involved in cell wall biosynthesis